MSQTHSDTSTNPISWLHVLGFVVVLWAASSDVLAQALVTEVRGNAIRANSAPLRALDTLRAGDRVRLSSDARAGFFVSEDSQLYLVDGPAEVLVGNKSVMANGKPVAPKQLDGAYRTIKAGGSELVQGSMVMRAHGNMRVLAPEGVVVAGDWREFTWVQQPGTWRFELSTDAGALVHRAEARNGKLVLPPEVSLQVGSKYVWGILPALGGTTPTDWTEFTVVEAGTYPAKPTEDASASEKILYATWLKSRGLERAAVRMVSSAAR
ncbi:hypothetical protein BWI17_05415 [Betaproteobacteria bacterium GR16-43]|nr:hypothetical protein BWI17_05415 [Betaproteobacteria bacterium GR16-43]